MYFVVPRLNLARCDTAYWQHMHMALRRGPFFAGHREVPCSQPCSICIGMSICLQDDDLSPDIRLVDLYTRVLQTSDEKTPEEAPRPG